MGNWSSWLVLYGIYRSVIIDHDDLNYFTGPAFPLWTLKNWYQNCNFLLIWEYVNKRNLDCVHKKKRHKRKYQVICLTKVKLKNMLESIICSKIEWLQAFTYLLNVTVFYYGNLIWNTMFLDILIILAKSSVSFIMLAVVSCHAIFFQYVLNN